MYNTYAHYCKRNLSALTLTMSYDELYRRGLGEANRLDNGILNTIYLLHS